MGSASSLPSRSLRTVAEPIETRIFSGKFLIKFSLACCSIMLTNAILRERDMEVGDLLLLGRICLFKNGLFILFCRFCCVRFFGFPC